MSSRTLQEPIAVEARAWPCVTGAFASARWRRRPVPAREPWGVGQHVGRELVR